MKINITQKIKSAYIFQILPDTVRSGILTHLNQKQVQEINGSLSKINTLEAKDQVSILKEFHRDMHNIFMRKKSASDRAVILSFSTLAMVAVLSITYSFLRYSTIDEQIRIIEQILNSGGMHFVLFPYIHYLIQIRNGRSSLRLLFFSRHYGIDLIISYMAAMAITAIFLTATDYSVSPDPDRIISIFMFISAVTVAPALEELFFRYYFFYYLGKKIGHKFGAIASSFIFAIIHIPDSPLLFALYFLTGILLCIIVYSRKSLFPAFVAHGVANGLLLLL